MVYYPVIIPTINRYQHFKECVESLAACTFSENTELVIGLDYPPSEKYLEGYLKIKNYISTIKGFGKITVFEHDHNLGPSENWRFLQRYCFEHYDACIGTEDDNVFSPCFLDYMNQALDRFRFDDRVLTVSGYNHEQFYDQGGRFVFLSKDSCGWGIGLWREKEEKWCNLLTDKKYYQNVVFSFFQARHILHTYPALYSMLDYMVEHDLTWGDVMRTTINILKGYRQLHPAISLVQNRGCDGSGVNCGDDDTLSKQKIFNSTFFEFGKETVLECSRKSKNALYYQGLRKGHQKEDIKDIKQKWLKNICPPYRYFVAIPEVLKNRLEKLKRCVTSR